MGFQANSNFQNAPTTTDGAKKKSNFRVGRIYGTDGTIDVSVWNSDKGGCYAICSIKAAIGKDPSTGANVYEQKMSGELPSIFMNIEILRALLEAMKQQKPESLNVSIDTSRGSKMSLTTTGSSIKVTIDNQKTGTRTVTLESIPVGSTTVHANYLNLQQLLTTCFKKAINNKLDPDEFATAIASGGDSDVDGDPF